LKRKDAVLTSKDKIRFLDELVHEAGHLSHDGDEADLGRFAVGAEPLVELGGMGLEREAETAAM
jgi:hypothetical protein